MKTYKDFLSSIKNNLSKYREELFDCDEDSQNIIYYSILEDKVVENIKNKLENNDLFRALKLYADPAFPHIFKRKLPIPQFYILSCYINALIDEGKYNKDLIYERAKNEYEKREIDYIHDIFCWWKEWNS